MRFSALLLCSCLLPFLAHVQLSNAQTSTDPRQLLSAASQSSAIAGEGAPPFRLQATFQIFDYMGKPTGTGTVEEVFLRPGKRKINVTIDGATYQYGLREEDGTLTALGKEAPFGFMMHMLAAALLSPLPLDTTLAGATVKNERKTFGSTQLDCIELLMKGNDKVPEEAKSSAYCLSLKPTMLRIAQQPYRFLIFYNRFARFGTHYQAQDISLRQGNILRGKLQVTSLIAEPAGTEAGGPGRIAGTLQSGIQTQLEVDAGPTQKLTPPVLVFQPDPVYPAGSKQKSLGGHVVITLVVRTDGSVADLDVLSSPANDLAEAALKSVRLYKFRPAIQDSKPVAFPLNVDVIFQIR